MTPHKESQGRAFRDLEAETESYSQVFRRTVGTEGRAQPYLLSLQVSFMAVMKA